MDADKRCRRSRAEPHGGSAPLLFAVFILCSACSLDYRPIQPGEDLLEETPETILFNFRHTVVRDGAVLRTLEAERAEVYDRRKETRLEKVYWVEYSADGSVITEAWADRAVWRAEREEGTISGAITIHSLEEDAWINAESLDWKGEEKVLTSEPDERVVIRKENGSRVEGRGFRADFRRKRIEFSAQVQGTYVSQEEQ